MPTRDHPPDRGFRRLLTASAVSNVGDGVRRAALPLLALAIGADGRLVGLVVAATFLPWVLVGPAAGALVDRADRARLVVAAQVVRGGTGLGLAAGVALDAAGPLLVIGAALVVGVGETVVDAASQAAVPQLVADDRLERANGQLTIAQTLLDQLAGAALGATLFAVWAPLPFVVDGASFLVSALLVRSIRVPLQPTSRPRAGRPVREGLRHLLADPLLRRLGVAVAVTNLGLHMGVSMLVVLVVDALAQTSTVYGLVLAGSAVGGVAGAAMADAAVRRYGLDRTMRLVHPSLALGLLATGLATDVAVVVAGSALAAGALSVFQVPLRALRQRHTPNHLLGRVVASFRLVGLSGPVLGAEVGGVIASTVDVRAAFLAGAVTVLPGGLLTARALRARRVAVIRPRRG